MERTEGSDRIDARRQEQQERLAMERRIQEAADAEPQAEASTDLSGPSENTFRYYDEQLGGEIHTSMSREGGIDSMVKADLYRHGEHMNIVGTARYHIEGSEAIVHGDTVIAANHGVESSLLNEVSEQARAQGVERLWVWSPDNSAGDGMRWARQGFQPAARDPGAAGVYWQRPLA